MALKRFSVSIEEEILGLLDSYIHEGRFPNRSDALRSLIRAQHVRQKFASREEVIGTLGVIYDHHRRNLVNKLLDIQHDAPGKVLGAQHFHLDHHHCLESIIIQGKACDLEDFCNKIQSVRGIKHTSFAALSPAKRLT
jgi:CopG family nickel-responsive transcriptional regulator